MEQFSGTASREKKNGRECMLIYDYI